MAHPLIPGGTTIGHEPSAPAQSDDTDSTISEAAKTLMRVYRAAMETFDICDRYMQGQHDPPYVPKDSSPEYRILADRSVNNVMPLVVGNLAQLLYIEDYLLSAEDEGSGAPIDKQPTGWGIWQANGMDKRQAPVYRTSLTYGVSYVVVLKDKKLGAKIRGVSPRNMIAVYEDPANDEWPAYAMERDAVHSNRWKIYDATGITPVEIDSDANVVVTGKVVKHGGPVCPVVRVAYSIDLEGRYQGEVMPLKTSQDRLNQTVMDRLMAQTFGSWKVRTISGMTLPDDDTQARLKKIKLSQDTFLVSEEVDTKFDSLPETPLAGYLQAANVDMESIAALGAIPPHYLTGSLNNLGAEAIAEARASLESKSNEIKHAFGECMEQVLRLCAFFDGDMDGWEDTSAEVAWHDAQNRSLNQVSDALGKLSTMLQVPAQALWSEVPGMTNSKLARWKQMADEESLNATIDEVNRANAEGVTDGEDATAANASPPTPGGEGS